MNRHVADTAGRIRRRVITAQPPALPGRVAAVWPHAERSWPAPLSAPTVRTAWNLPRRLAARTHPRTTHRAALLAWGLLALVLYLTGAVATAVLVVASPLRWVVAQLVAAVLVVAGWTPPLVLDLDVTALDQTADRSAPASTPAPASVVPLSWEERQVQALEANAAAVHQLAYAEATRPAPAPVPLAMVTYHRTPGGFTFRRLVGAWAVMVVLFWFLVYLGATRAPIHQPTTLTPTTLAPPALEATP